MKERCLTKPPSRTIPQFNLRVPAELKEFLAECAHKNKRSLNAEILLRLEDSARMEMDQ
jgi:predicted HicB family RNase H-like nuclease